MSDSQEFHSIYLYFILGIVFVLMGYFLNAILSKRNPSTEKNSSYECGEESLHFPTLSFNPKFVLIAIAFVLFEVELIFLFPWIQTIGVSASKQWLMYTGIEMLIFIGILYLGVVHLIVHKDLDWLVHSSTVDAKVPDKYQAINNVKYTVKPFVLEKPEELPQANSPVVESKPKILFKPKMGLKNNG